MRLRSTRRAFTLIELLVVVTVMAILASMTVAILSHVRSGARSVVCQGSVRQLGMASILFAGDNRGRWPMSEWQTAPTYWGMRIGEYMEGFSGKAFVGGQRPPVPFACPESKWMPEPNAIDFGSDYAKNVYAGGYSNFSYVTKRPMAAYQVSSTIGYADNMGGKTAKLVDEGTREIGDYNPGGTWGMGFWRHRGRSNVVFMDGHVESMLQKSIQFTDPRQAPWNWLD